MLELFNLLSERARGFIITITTGAGAIGTKKAQEVVDSAINLEPLQRIALIVTIIVGALTIISYGYKFYKFCRAEFLKKRNK